MFTLLLLLAPVGQDPAPEQAQPYLHVLAISVDGLRSDALTAADPGSLPAFARLLTGAHTLNARPDPVWSVTLPNHSDMLTGRPVEGAEGHGWRENIDPPIDGKLHLANGSIPEGVYSVTSAHEVVDRLYAAKSKFRLYTQTWSDIDDYRLQEKAPASIDALLAAMEKTSTEQASFTFLHLREPDDAGHAHGWVLDRESPYMKAVRSVDDELGRLLTWLDQHPKRAARTAIILTSDHGGGIPLHNHTSQGRQWVNVIIPFLIWTGDGRAHGNLYRLNHEQRRNPGLGIHEAVSGSKAPIRNGEVANLSLSLLGLPPVPGSVFNATQDLRWAAQP